MRVKRLRLTNFRGFESLELDLDRSLTVLVGVNGSGKTSVLRAICAAAVQLQGTLGHATTHELPLDSRDVWVGAGSSEVLCSLRHLAWDFEVRLQGVDREGLWTATSSKVQSVDAMMAVARSFVFLVSTERQFQSASVNTSDVQGNDDIGAVPRAAGYGRFLAWFKEREDAENARRVAREDLSLQDPQLRAVREAVAEVMPGFEKLRIERDLPHPAMVVTKSGVELRLDQLSDGERNLIALAGDLARRMVIANPSSDAPREAEGLILIDEVEQHMHPAWQRRVIPALQRAFPKAQLVVTTHSPQVLSSVAASSIVRLDGASAHAITSATAGRDTNAILREVFGVPERPQPDIERVRAVRSLIDEGRLDEARGELDALAAALSEVDDEVVALRMRMLVAEAAA